MNSIKNFIIIYLVYAGLYTRFDNFEQFSSFSMSLFILYFISSHEIVVQWHRYRYIVGLHICKQWIDLYEYLALFR